MTNKGYRENSSLVNKRTNQNNISSFFGINFALSVEKKLRWSTSCVKALVLRADNNVGFVAPQLPQSHELLAGMSHIKPEVKQHEQCLNLNVFTPNEMGKLPVMVWIHGGGFQIGSGSLPAYDGNKLAQTANVVVVTINYRLGALGFLRLCDITDGVINATGNEGLGDQITALKWIQENINNYGGDKNNVTVFGESAGAMSIACLLASPQAKGLFHKAILQSGASHTYSSVEKANNVAKEFVNSANSLGFTMEDLPLMSTQDILSVQQHFLKRPEIYQQFGVLPFSPVVEEDLLPLPPHEAIKQGSAKDIVLLSGTNTDEWTLFAAMTGQNVTTSESLNASIESIMEQSLVPQCLALAETALNGRSREISPQNNLSEILCEYWFTQPCHRLLANHTISGGRNYRYKLGRRTIIPALGCTHIADLGFVFAQTEKTLHGENSRIDTLIEQIQSSWGTFAHTGDPSTNAIEWPIYGSGNKLSYVFFDHDSTYINVHNIDNVTFWSNITDQQLASF
jgi:para-nitrobenzyl esterase